jgi:hypothetical protein
LHGLYLLLPLDPSLVEYLVLGLDARDLALHFTLPFVALGRETLLAALFEATNLIKLGLLLDFKERLLHGFSEKYVQDWLHFTIVVEEVIVFDLGDLVDTCLLRDIRWGRWPREELISLGAAIILNGRFLALLG